MAQRDTIEAAVVTGGHSYDVPNFHRLFRSLKGIEAYIQSLDDYASSSDETRDAYDVACFYFMPVEGPTDEGLPWYAGQPKRVLERLGTTRQGILLLHHALVAYPEWPRWAELVGTRKNSFDYHIGESVKVDVAAPDHPITRGLTSWTHVDETYEMAGVGEGGEILLTTEHPQSMPTLGWTRRWGEARVFCLQLGHDNDAWEVRQFREVLRRGLLWCAGRI
jgi:hypothetical protein